MTHKVLLLIFPLIIFLTTPGCSDKPWLCLPGVRSKPCTRHCQVKQKRPVAGDKTNPEIQTSESNPGNWKCSRLWDPGVNKGRTVLPAWGGQFLDGHTGEVGGAVGAQSPGSGPGPREARKALQFYFY